MLYSEMKPWPTKKLGEIAKIIVGKTPAKVDYLDIGKHKVLKYRDITKSGIVWNINDKGFVKETAPKGMKEIEIGDLLITSAGHSSEKIGEEAVIINNLPSQFKKVYFASELICFRANQKILSPYWLLFYLQSGAGQYQLKKIIGDSVHLTKEKSQELQIPLPPLNIQKQIVSKIEEVFEKIDKAIELRKRALEETKQIFPSALQEVFKEAEKKWEVETLGEIIELLYEKGIPEKDRKADGKYPIYGANGELGRSDKYLVEGAAIIIGRKGTAGAVNRVSGRFWPADVTYYVFGNEKINIDFLFYVFKKNDLSQLAVGIKPGINRNKVYELQIPLPPLPKQKRIVAYLNGVREKVEKLKNYQESQLKDLEELKQSILDKACKGELIK